MAERAHPEDRGFRPRLFGLRRNPYREGLFARYAFCKRFIRGRAILDVPCGTGWGTSTLRGYATCLGVDLAEDAVAYANRRYARRKTLRFEVGNMASLPVPSDAIDVVLCLDGFEHVDRETGVAFLAECQRVLRRGGLLIMTIPVLNEYGGTSGNPYHLCEYPEEELIQTLNERFRILELLRIEGPDAPEYRGVLQNVKGERYLDPGRMAAAKAPGVCQRAQ